MDEEDLARFETKWNEIYSQGIEKVFRIAETKQNEIFNLEQYTKLYTIVYDICVTRSHLVQVKCYERLCETMKFYFQKKCEKIQTDYIKSNLAEFVENYITFEETVLKWILKFFSYLVNTIIIF
jgi:hypothetical protein